MAVILKKKIYSTHNIEEIEFIDEEIYQARYPNNSFPKLKYGEFNL